VRGPTETVVRVQVRLGSRLYTYGVLTTVGREPKPGDSIIIPAPEWLPDIGPREVSIRHVGDGCVDTGYRGALTMARLVTS
jgi:hypothetical protein